MINLLTDLADVLEKHDGELSYTYSDDGVHVSINDEESYLDVSIGWPGIDDNMSELRRVIHVLQEKIDDND